MKFQLFHNRYFNAVIGSYSLVTIREEFDSQITLTDAESEMVINYFGLANIQFGNVVSNKDKAKKIFYLYPDFKPVELNLVFPKKAKLELRLYLSKRAGFKPISGNIWFLYIDKKNRLVIGSFIESDWNDLDQVDVEDEEYLEEVQEIIKENVIKRPPKPQIIKIQTGARISYKRNSAISAFALASAGYMCEIDKKHSTFISQRTNLPYSESHHFIPMKFQDNFTFPLDCTENIISLCPNCHRGFHHAISDHKKALIKKVFDSKKILNDFEIGEVYSFYNSLQLT